MRYVDPYGDTYFNTLQMGDLIADWQMASVWASGQREEEFALQVQDLAERCRDGTHLYLLFVGD